MNKYFANEKWNSAETVPDTDRNVILDCYGFEDMTVGYYLNGKWYIQDRDIGTDIDVEVRAWADFPLPTRQVPHTFRTAEEARYLSMQTLNQQEHGEYDADFYEVRNRIIEAVSTPNCWKINIGKNRPLPILNALNDAGFTLIENEDGSVIVSWLF